MVRATKPTALARNANRSAGSDEDLFLRFRTHEDRTAFEELVHRYERELFGYLRRYTGNSEMAEDVFQATFFQIHQKRDLYDAEQPFRPWLYSIATRLGIDAMRRAGRRRTVSLDRPLSSSESGVQNLTDLLEAETPSPLMQMQEQERRNWVRSAVSNLPEHQRQVVDLVFFQGLKYREAADMLGVPVGTVKSRMNKALIKLGGSWEEAEFPEELLVGCGSSGSMARSSTIAFVGRMLDLLEGREGKQPPPPGLVRKCCDCLWQEQSSG